jgi:hypothetical protein
VIAFQREETQLHSWVDSRGGSKTPSGDWSVPSTFGPVVVHSCSGISVGPPLTKPLDVWLGGIAPSELRRVGRLADGWLPSFINASQVTEKKRLAEEAAITGCQVVRAGFVGATTRVDRLV